MALFILFWFIWSTLMIATTIMMMTITRNEDNNITIKSIISIKLLIMITTVTVMKIHYNNGWQKQVIKENKTNCVQLCIRVINILHKRKGLSSIQQIYMHCILYDKVWFTTKLTSIFAHKAVWLGTVWVNTLHYCYCKNNFHCVSFSNYDAYISE